MTMLVGWPAALAATLRKALPWALTFTAASEKCALGPYRQVGKLVLLAEEWGESATACS
jgi:hypothetical protein